MRLKEFCRELRKNKIDAALFLSRQQITDNLITYFTGIHGLGFCLFVAKNDGKNAAFMSNLDKGDALAQKYRGIKVRTIKKKKLAELAAMFKKKRKVTLGINKKRMTLADLKSIRKCFEMKKVNIMDVYDIVDDLQAVKIKKEIENIRKACRITDRIMKDMILNASKLKTENKVADFIKEKAKHHGVELSFPVIVASGKNVYAHHTPTNKKISKFCIVDFGVRYKNYCSDMTRTFYVGVPSKEEIAAYDAVLRAQEEAVSNCIEGNTGKNVDSVARTSLGPLKKYFTHPTGHMVGVDVHDSVDKALAEYSKYKLRENNVLTVEPGIYIPKKFGIRIEDTVLVGKNKAECLTKFRKNLIIIPKII